MNQIAPPPLQSFPVEGMTCASCVRRVEKAIAAVPGVESASVNLATERADVRLAAPATPQAVIAAIKGAGYEVARQTIDVGVEGMTCASCVLRVEKALKKVPGVASATVNLATESAHVEAATGTLPSALEAAVAAAGYAAHWQPADAPPARAVAIDGRPLAVAAVLTLPLALPMLALLAGLTPFKPLPALAMALVACVAGTLGHVVMKAIKRDRGVPHWGTASRSVTGAAGLLDRVDALCLAAPVFFHSVRWYFQLRP